MAIEGNPNFDKVCTLISTFRAHKDTIDDKPVLLGRLQSMAKKLLVKQERVEALLALAGFEEADHASIIDALLLLQEHCDAHQRKLVFRLAVKYDIVHDRRNELLALLDQNDPEYRYLCTQLPADDNNVDQVDSVNEVTQPSAFDSMPVDNPFKDEW